MLKNENILLRGLIPIAFPRKRLNDDDINVIINKFTLVPAHL